MQKSSITDVSQASRHPSGLNFKNFSIHFTLHQVLKRCWIKLLSMCRQQNFKISQGKKLNSVSKYLQFSWEIPEYKDNTFFLEHILLLKLIYWNKSIQRINIIITTNQYQEEPPAIIEKFPRRQLWEGSVIWKNLMSHFDMNIFPELFWYCHNFSRKISVVFVISIVFICEFFAIFRKTVFSIEMGNQYVSSLI